MPKYQFFSKPESNRREFTYLDMDSDNFLQEKPQLLDLGFEVEDDVIYANTPEEAVDKFKSNFTYHLDEYANSHVEGGIATFLFEMSKKLFGKK